MEELSRRLGQLSPRVRAQLTAALWLLAACAVAWCVFRGFNGPNRRLDARPLLLAGHAWLLGQSPYSLESYSRLWEQVFESARPDAFVFAYPPSAAALLVPLALPGVQPGLVLLDGLNLVSLGLALLLCARLGGEGAAPEWRGAARAAALALAASCGALSGTLLIGQTSLWALAALLWLWGSSSTSRLRISDVFAVSVAAMKPSLTLPLLCFLALLRPKLVGWAAALSLVVCAAVAAATEGAALPGEWLRAVSLYASTSANLPAELASGQHLLGLAAPALPAWSLAALGALAGVVLGWSARRADSADSLDELWLAAVALALACSPAHEYDLVLAAPLAALLVRARRVTWPWYLFGVLAVARPAALGRVAAAIGHGDPAELERVISALGTVFLAAGSGVHWLLHAQLLRASSRLTRTASA